MPVRGMRGMQRGMHCWARVRSFFRGPVFHLTPPLRAVAAFGRFAFWLHGPGLLGVLVHVFRGLCFLQVVGFVGFVGDTRAGSWVLRRLCRSQLCSRVGRVRRGEQARVPGVGHTRACARASTWSGEVKLVQLLGTHAHRVCHECSA